MAALTVRERDRLRPCPSKMLLPRTWASLGLHLGWTPLVAGVSLARNWAAVGKLVLTRSTCRVVSVKRKSSTSVGRVTLSPSMRSAAKRPQPVLRGSIAMTRYWAKNARSSSRSKPTLQRLGSLSSRATRRFSMRSNRSSGRTSCCSAHRCSPRRRRIAGSCRGIRMRHITDSIRRRKSRAGSA
jgi:hypothetical protein